MKKYREGILATIATMCVLGAGIRVLHAAGEAVEFAPKPLTTSSAHVVISEDSIGQAAASAVANDPFRLANRPATVRYDARSEGGPGAPPPPPPVRPAFVLKAIVGGPPWQAMIDGIPGQPAGTIVRPGAVFEKITVKAINRDTVVMQGPDTAWKLTIKRDR